MRVRESERKKGGCEVVRVRKQWYAGGYEDGRQSENGT